MRTLTDRRAMRAWRGLTLLSMALVSACGESGNRKPYVPYIPAPGFRETLTIQLEVPDSGVAVGQWITLHAQRESGPWEPITIAVNPPEDPPCEKVRPVVSEYEAASKVEWVVEPKGSVGFNVPGPPEFERQIRFTRPGRYRVHAVSQGCTRPFASDTVEVVVR